MTNYDNTLKVLQKNIISMSRILAEGVDLNQEIRNNINLCLTALPDLLKMLDDNGYHYTYTPSFTGFYMWRNLDDNTINSKEIKCLPKKLKLDTTSTDIIVKQIYNELTSEVKNKETEVIALFLPIFYGICSPLDYEFTWYSTYHVINIDEEEIKETK